MSDREHLAWQLRDQAASCAVMGSRLYADLLARAADDVAAGGPIFRLLERHVAPGRGNALALRFMAAVHRLVLVGAARDLARHYPSTGGEPAQNGAVWNDFRAAVDRERETLDPWVALPCQTNEVGRCAALIFGFLAAARRAPLPLRLLELGASAGLSLRWDRFRYGTVGGETWGDADSRVDLVGLWREAPRDVGVGVTVVERRGCDLHPIDPASEPGRLSLRSSIWADQTARFGRLQGALALAARVPARVEEASVEAWLPRQLAEPREGQLTIVFHSVVQEYLSADVRTALEQGLREAGARATAAAPLAWVRLEPTSTLRHHGVQWTQWPGGGETVVALSGAHGSDSVRAPL